MPTDKLIDVVIPSYKHPLLLKNFLTHLPNSTNLKLNTHVIVERDDEETIELLKEFDIKILFNLHYKSAVAAVNYGVDNTYSDYLFVTGDDIHYDHGVLDEAYELIVGHKSPIVCGFRFKGKSITEKLVHSATFLINRDYIQKRKFFYNRTYQHGCADLEFSGKAIADGQWTMAKSGYAHYQDEVRCSRLSDYRDVANYCNRRNMWEKEQGYQIYCDSVGYKPGSHPLR